MNARNVLNIADVDNVPEYILDSLAWAWAIDWYNTDANAAVKRATIKSAPTVHACCGTPAAIKQVVSDMLGNEAWLEEWFDYDGTEYHFRIISAGPILTSEAYNTLMVLLTSVKNTRSVCDGLSWSFTTSSSARAMGAIIGMGGAITLAQAAA